MSQEKQKPEIWFEVLKELNLVFEVRQVKAKAKGKPPKVSYRLIGEIGSERLDWSEVDSLTSKRKLKYV